MSAVTPPPSAPETPECVRAQALLDRRLEEELLASDEAFLDAHLVGCPTCGRLAGQLESAFTALGALSAADRSVLAGAAFPEPEDPDSGRLTTVLVAGALLLALLCGIGAYLLLGPKAEPVTPPPVVANLQVAPILPEVGGGLGVEEDPDYVLIEAPVVEAEPVVVARRPEPVAKQPAPVAQNPGGKPPRPQPQPKNPQLQPKDPAPKPPPPPPKEPLPDQLLAQLGRLQLSNGLRYRGVTFFFVRDPDETKRLGSARRLRPLTATEPRPRDPKGLVVRAQGAVAGTHLLLGELLDAPFGLRYAPTTRRLLARSTLVVEPIRYEPLARTRPRPIVKGPVLLPSSARHAELTRAKVGAVAVFLQLLNDPRLDPIERLRTELGEVESEANDLERRFRAITGKTRGLVGVGVSVDGVARSLDVFDSPRMLTVALPKLLRTALLEARLGKPYDRDAAVDPRSTGIERGVKDGRDDQVALLALLSQASVAKVRDAGPMRKIDARYEVLAADERAGVILCEGEALVHAVAIAPIKVSATKR